MCDQLPTESYEFPLIRCSRCMADSTVTTVVDVDDNRICYKNGKMIQLCIIKHQRYPSHLCYRCIESMGWEYLPDVKCAFCHAPYTRFSAKYQAKGCNGQITDDGCSVKCGYGSVYDGQTINIPATLKCGIPKTMVCDRCLKKWS
jgi:hypothetical protein